MVYRSDADVPADRLASSAKVRTALGDALVFTQPYYECTNSCRNYTEPVAVVTLDHPYDPAHPTLMAYSEKGTIGLLRERHDRARPAQDRVGRPAPRVTTCARQTVSTRRP